MTPSLIVLSLLVAVGMALKGEITAAIVTLVILAILFFTSET